MTQSIYASASLLDLNYDLENAVILIVLWIISTAIIEARLLIGIVFLVLALYEAVRSRGHIIAFSAFRQTLREGVLRKHSHSN
jgi:hypothetical protein